MFLLDLALPGVNIDRSPPWAANKEGCLMFNVETSGKFILKLEIINFRARTFQ